MKSPIANPVEPLTQPPASVTVEINELVLHGFDRADRHEIGEALRRELGQLLSKRGIPPSWNGNADLARAKAASINLPPVAKPTIVGKQVARAVYNQIARPASRGSTPSKKS